MLKNDPNLKGNDRFEGYCVDLGGGRFNKGDFNYQIVLVKDGKYGSYNENGTWDGMIGELVRQVISFLYKC